MARRKKTNCEFQVDLLNSDLKELDPTDAYYPLWTRLISFLAAICDVLSDLQGSVRGDGNDTRGGLLNRMTVIEGLVKVSQSDIREILNTLRSVYGMDKDSLSKQFDKENHPNRREADGENNFDKVLRYVLEKILPQIIVWMVLGWIAFTIAVNEHIIIAK